VFHNRSDAFIENHLNGKEGGLPNLDRLLDSLDMPLRHRGTITQSLKNQYSAYLGKHLLPNGMHFVQALNTQRIDLVILDNYMDITPVLKSPVWAPESKVFVNHAHINNAKDVLVSDAHALPVTASVENFHLICQVIRQKQPTAMIAFLQFPYNLYSSKKRHHRCALFQTQFSLDDIPYTLVVPPLTIPQDYMDGVPQHYTPEQYTFYAGIIYAEMAARGQVIQPFAEGEAPTVSHDFLKEGAKPLGFIEKMFGR